jgi:hypothetical protein
VPVTDASQDMVIYSRNRAFFASGPWAPLITVDEQEPYLEMLYTIEDHLRDPEAFPRPSEEPPPDAPRMRRHPVLQGLVDDLGCALVHAYLERSLPERGTPGAWEPCLDSAFVSVSENVLPPAPIGGFVQVAWVAEHLRRSMLGPAGTGVPQRSADASGDEDELEEIDEFLAEFLARTPWPDTYDLISGLVGYGTYALERLPRESGRTLLELVVTRLEEMAERSPDGVTWFTPGRLLPAWQREEYPDGYYNLGLAHGIPGVIAILAAAAAADIVADRCRPLLEGAVRWLLAQRLPPDATARFQATMIPGGVSRTTARLAWCYGDAGIAVSLLGAARLAELPDLEEAALDIALGAARRDPQTSQVVDGSLCHGCCGLGHMFNRLWHATGDERFAVAARYWFEDARRRFEEHPGLIGLMHPGEPDLGRDLITGSAGMGLALIAALSAQPPDWDRLLLMSMPGRLREREP